MRRAHIYAGLLSILLAASAAYCGNEKPRRSADNSPDVGNAAPDFNLITLDGFLKDGDSSTNKVMLSSFRAKKPVVFVLSSYT